MPTILSRFDMIFIIRDDHNERRDANIASHVLDIHINSNRTIAESAEGEISVTMLKKYISYCRA